MKYTENETQNMIHCVSADRNSTKDKVAQCASKNISSSSP